MVLTVALLMALSALAVAFTDGPSLIDEIRAGVRVAYDGCSNFLVATCERVAEIPARDDVWRGINPDEFFLLGNRVLEALLGAGLRIGRVSSGVVVDSADQSNLVTRQSVLTDRLILDIRRPCRIDSRDRAGFFFTTLG